MTFNSIVTPALINNNGTQLTSCIGRARIGFSIEERSYGTWLIKGPWNYSWVWSLHVVKKMCVKVGLSELSISRLHLSRVSLSDMGVSVVAAAPGGLWEREPKATIIWQIIFSELFKLSLERGCHGYSGNKIVSTVIFCSHRQRDRSTERLGRWWSDTWQVPIFGW